MNDTNHRVKTGITRTSMLIAGLTIIGVGSIPEAQASGEHRAVLDIGAKRPPGGPSFSPLDTRNVPVNPNAVGGGHTDNYDTHTDGTSHGDSSYHSDTAHSDAAPHSDSVILWVFHQDANPHSDSPHSDGYPHSDSGPGGVHYDVKTNHTDSTT